MNKLFDNLAELQATLEQAGHSKVASSVNDLLKHAQAKTTLGPKGRNVVENEADDVNALKAKLDNAKLQMDQARNAYMGIAGSAQPFDTGQQQAKELLNKWMAAKAAFETAKEEYAYATNAHPGLYEQLQHDSRKPMPPLMFGVEHGGSLPQRRKEVDVAKTMPPSKVQK